MLLPVLALLLQAAPDARLVRYPHVHQNKIAFTYLGDIWTAATDGSDIRRLTVHTARDAWPRAVAGDQREGDAGEPGHGVTRSAASVAARNSPSGDLTWK